MYANEDFNLKAKIHTSQITVKGAFGKEDFLPEHRDCVTVVRSSLNKEEPDKSKSTFIINPHKGEEVEIETFGEFMIKIEKIMVGAGIEKYRIDRVDLCFDSTDPEHYHRYEKMYRMIVCGVAISNEMRNNYRTFDLFNPVQISAATKGFQIEAEHYDRRHKNIVLGNDTDPTCSRFEIRTKRFDNADIRKEFMVSWSRRLDAAIDSRAFVERRCNEFLAKLYTEQKDQRPKRFSNIYDFLMFNQDSLYSRKQILQLLEMIGIDQNKEGTVRNYQQRYGVEYVKNVDLELLIADMKRAMKEYFES